MEPENIVIISAKDAESIIYDEETPIQLLVYNMNTYVERVNLLSDKNPEHTGVKIIRDKLNLLKNPSTVLNQIKLKTADGIDHLDNLGYYYGGRKDMYLNYFSKNQYQSTVIVIPSDKYFEKGLEFEIPAMRYIYITLFPSKYMKDTSSFTGWPKEEVEKTLDSVLLMNGDDTDIFIPCL